MSVESMEWTRSPSSHWPITVQAEYRTALGSTSQYREYLQKLGASPPSDVEPVLEAIPDGAIAVGKDERVLYVNRALYDTTGIFPGLTLEDVVARLDPRTLSGERLPAEVLPERLVLKGGEVREFLMRIHPEFVPKGLVLSVNGCPVRDIFGRVVAAVMVARIVSEEVAQAMQDGHLPEAIREDLTLVPARG